MAIQAQACGPARRRRVAVASRRGTGVVRRRTTLAPPVLVVLTALGLTACVHVFEHQKLSRSRLTPSTRGDWAVRTDGNIVGPGLRLALEPRNSQTTVLRTPMVIIPLPPVPEVKNHGSAPFTIRIDAYTEVEVYTLDLANIGLSVGPDAILTPKRVLDCSTDPQVLASGTVQLSRDCYVLEYDRRPPSPSTSFSLVIPGLRRSGVVVDLPPIVFVEWSLGWVNTG